MSIIDNNYLQPGHVEFPSIFLVSGVTGNPIDIGNLVLEINIYSSVYSHYLQCDVTLIDAMNLYDWKEMFGSSSTSGGFTGLDFFVFEYRNKGEEKTKSHAFRINRLVARKTSMENADVYVLGGISLESYVAATKRISRSLKGLVSDMIGKVFENDVFNPTLPAYAVVQSLVTSVITKFNSIDSNSDGEQKIIVPNLPVDDTIDFLCSEADSSDHIPFFVFYEDLNNGFIVKNLSERKDSKITYYDAQYTMPFTEDTGTNDPLKENPFRITTWEVKKQADFLENLRGGLYGATTFHLDILQRQYNKKVFNYEQSKGEFKNIQSTKFPMDKTLKYDDSYHTFMTSRTGHDIAGPYVSEGHKPKRINEFLDKKRSYRRQLFNTVMNVTVPFNSDLNVGEEIELVFPLKTDIGEDKQRRDDHLSGKYLITKLRHKFDGGKSSSNSFTILECCKDTSLLPD
jgi:hypothetical protein